jgi:hypothetical protein
MTGFKKLILKKLRELHVTWYKQEESIKPVQQDATIQHYCHLGSSLPQVTGPQMSHFVSSAKTIFVPKFVPTCVL